MEEAAVRTHEPHVRTTRPQGQLGRSCWERREPGLVPCDDLEGWDAGEEGGKGGRGCMYNDGQFELLNFRNQHNIVKIKKKKNATY